MAQVADRGPAADDPLADYLAAELQAGSGSPEADRAAVLELWTSLFGDDSGELDLGLFEDALDASPESLKFEAGTWTLDLSSSAVRTALTLATLAGGLALLGVASLAPVLLPAVIPILFDLRRTKVTAGQEAVYAELKLRPEARAGGSAQSLYEMLSPDSRRNLSFLDFADTLEALRLAGRADRRESGQMSIRPRPRFRITIT
jgi:hypothetical protein